MLNLARRTESAQASPVGVEARAPRVGREPLTLQDLVEVVAECADSDAEVIATIQHMISRGIVRFERGSRSLEELDRT